MLRPMFCLAILVSTSTQGFSQPEAREAPAGRSHIHSCSVDTGAGWPGSGSGSAKAAAASLISARRIELQFAVAPPAPGSTLPTVTAHAINTKGTGMAGRGVSPGGTVTISCAAIAADAAARQIASPAGSPSGSAPDGIRWSCAVSGSERAPSFTLTLFVPPASGPEATNWSFGTTNAGSSPPPAGSGAGRVAIVVRGTGEASATTIPCSSRGRRAVGYDLAIARKA